MSAVIPLFPMPPRAPSKGTLIHLSARRSGSADVRPLPKPAARPTPAFHLDLSPAA